MIRNKFLFYFLSFVWGLPITIIGCFATILLLITGYKPQKWGYCWYFEVGESWGGVNLGPVFIVNKNASKYTKSHELGHSFHNCWFGPLMPLVVSIPSAIRYWYRIIRCKIGTPCKTRYDSVWFESAASSLGKDFMKWYENNTK